MKHAAAFLEVADLVAGDGTDDAHPSVAAALAVLAGIAASDAACCHVVGERHRGDDHRGATALLAEVRGGEDAARRLARLLDLKDTAQYGLIHVSATNLKRAIRDAAALVSFAEQTMRR